MKLLITGGAGFIGSNFVHYVLEHHPEYEVVVVDKLTYAGNLSNLESALAAPRVSFRRLDICDPALCDAVRECDFVVNFAAESHVDRSIESASAFVRTNVQGTLQVLEACRLARVRRFLQVSTDEVYGSLGPSGRFRESTPLAPNSPYAASKAAADLLVMSFVATYKLPAVITRCSNNYGPYQFPEKFIPLMIAQAMSKQFLPIYSDGQNVRDWIHVYDHCSALDLVLHQGKEGQIYNVGGECELKNIDVARLILRALEAPEDLIRYVADRPSHDRRYAIDCSKLKTELGWRQRHDFAAGLADTIRWYRANTRWLHEIWSTQYRDYFERHYARRDQYISSTQATSALQPL